MTVEKINVAESNKQRKVLSQSTGIGNTYQQQYWQLVLVSAILYCQSTIIGTDNSFHEYC